MTELYSRKLLHNFTGTINLREVGTAWHLIVGFDTWFFAIFSSSRKMVRRNVLRTRCVSWSYKDLNHLFWTKDRNIWTKCTKPWIQWSLEMQSVCALCCLRHHRIAHRRPRTPEVCGTAWENPSCFFGCGWRSGNCQSKRKENIESMTKTLSYWL